VKLEFHRPRFPPALHPASVSMGATVILALIVAISQGLDYIARPDETSFTLGIVEQKLSLDFWGICFLIFALVTLIGLVFAFWPLAIVGHGVLSVTYLCFGAGVFWSVFIADWRGYGWNTGVLYFCLAAFHALLTDGCYDEWAREWKRPPPPTENDEG